MSAFKHGFFTLLFLSVIAIGNSLLHADNTDNDSTHINNLDAYSIPKTIRYRLTVRNTSNEFIQQSNFKTYAPVKQTSNQVLEKLSASQAFELIEDKYGNQILDFSIENLPPYGVKVITVTAIVRFSPQAQVMPSPHNGAFLAPENYVESDHPAIRQAAKRFEKFTQADKAKPIFNWVSQHIKDTNYIKRDRGAVYALKAKKGDCTEFMYLTMALLRNQNIPARGVGGFIIGDNSAILHAEAYHNWAEYYQAGRWHIADPLNKILDAKTEYFLSFRIINNDEKDPLSNTHRFLVFDKRLKVKMG